MATNPEVSGALVIGAQRFQAALLIEPLSEDSLTTAEQADLIERVWASVEEANRSAPAHAQVEKALILVVPPDRRFIRSGKGTFMRGATISQYETEIDALYANADTVEGEVDSQAVRHDTSLDVVTQIIRERVLAVTKWSSIDHNDSFFDHGMDSLQGLQLLRALRRSLQRPDLALSTIYQNSTISELAEDICKGQDSEKNERKVMEGLLVAYKQHVQDLSVSSETCTTTASAPVNILLTGSTGTVGRYLLKALLDHPDTGHVFCLNRGEDGGSAAQYESFASAGLSSAGLTDRVTFIKAVLHQKSLGLDKDTYESLRTQVDIVIHAAWPVNFNLALLSFRSQLAGLVNLLGFAASTASSRARFVFISSVSAVEGYENGPAPEAVLHELDTPAPLGYARSKFLGELIVDTAAKHFQDSISATIIRVGQVSGPVMGPGLWNPHEWFPSMILSSQHMGIIPNSLGKHFDKVDFVPVDLLANILVELATSTSAGEVTSGAKVFNLRNPRLTTWSALLPVAAEAVEPHLQVVTPETWLASLKKSDEKTHEDNEATIHPASKLIDFFTGLWASDAGRVVEPMLIDSAMRASPTLRSLEPVQQGWIRKWIRDWAARQKV